MLFCICQPILVQELRSYPYFAALVPMCIRFICCLGSYVDPIYLLLNSYVDPIFLGSAGQESDSIRDH